MLQIGLPRRIGQHQTLPQQCIRRKPPQRTFKVASLSDGSWQIATFAKLRTIGDQSVVTGPYRPSTRCQYAAMQLQETGHWCIAQHFQMVNDGTADFVDVRCELTNVWFADVQQTVIFDTTALLAGTIFQIMRLLVAATGKRRCYG